MYPLDPSGNLLQLAMENSHFIVDLPIKTGDLPIAILNYQRVKVILFVLKMVGGFKHVLFSIIYGIILPIDFHIFQDG